MKENPLKLHDLILQNLINNDYGMATFKELIESIFPEVKIKEEDLKKYEGMAFLENVKPLKVIGALYHLKQEKYIDYNETTLPVHNTNVVITQKGMIKIMTIGFYKEYKRNIWNYRIERYSKIITPLIALSAFSLALYNYLYPKK